MQVGSSLPSSPPDTPIMHWSREQVLEFADVIREKMSGWEACVHTIGDLKVTTTPTPNATIVIVDINTGAVLKKIP